MNLDAIKTLIDLYGDTWEAYYCAAEERYIEKYHKMPDWAHFIEKLYLYQRNGLIRVCS